MMTTDGLLFAATLVLVATILLWVGEVMKEKGR